MHTLVRLKLTKSLKTAQSTILTYAKWLWSPIIVKVSNAVIDEANGMPLLGHHYTNLFAVV